MTPDSLPATTKVALNAAAITTPIASYLSGVSLVITILAGLASLIWMSLNIWEKVSPRSYQRFVKWMDRRG